MRKNIALYTRAEKSILLYAETCLVDNLGRMTNIKMNDEDFENLRKLKEEGLLDFGRLPFHEIERLSKVFGRLTVPTHWVSFSDETWEIVSAMRKERADKGKEQFQKMMEKY
jgi:hypothetical protein